MTMLLVLAIPAGLLALTLTLLYPRGSADGSSGAVLDLDDSQVAVLPDRVRLVRLDASTSGAACAQSNGPAITTATVAITTRPST